MPRRALQERAHVLTEPLSRESIKPYRACMFTCGYAKRICVGLCQEMAELSGMRRLLHSLVVGVSVMRVAEACLCVWASVSPHPAYAYVQCVGPP